LSGEVLKHVWNERRKGYLQAKYQSTQNWLDLGTELLAKVHKRCTDSDAKLAKTKMERDVARANETKLKDRLKESLDKVRVADARAASAEEELAKVKTEKDEARAERAQAEAKARNEFEKIEACIARAAEDWHEADVWYATQSE
jgi:chromosome segregation ATPase